MKKISLVIPVYQNEKDVTRTFNEIKALFSNELKAYEFECWFINDGSTDGSLLEIKDLHAQFPSVFKYLSFSRNFGQIAAIAAGLKETKGDACIIMSADLQDPPSLIVNMVEKWESGKQVVICTRTDREDDWFAKITSKFFYGLMKMANPKMPAGGFDFIFLDRVAVNELNLIDERNRFIQGDILWLGYDVEYIPYKRNKRLQGKSQWTLSKKTKYFIDGLLNTSYLPIRFCSLAGVVFAFLGFLYSILVFYDRMVNNQNPKGWAPIMIVLLILGGLILFMLGIIGEYLWRTYDEARGRKTFIIRERGD